MCSKNKYTKSESNSQLTLQKLLLIVNCVQRTNIQNLKAIHNSRFCFRNSVAIVFKEQIYKIWKQFTTIAANAWERSHCVQRTNIQNLKAIHNSYVESMKDYQLCSKNKYTKSESNSQLAVSAWAVLKIVFKEQIYKIWKQFTTCGKCMSCLKDCVQRTNIQNLKAIHNSSSS